jgi:hypothetical protein
MQTILYTVVGSKGEYEDRRHVLVGVFDTKEKAVTALNAALEYISQGAIHSPEDIESFYIKCGRLYSNMAEACNDYNPADFRIEGIPLNEMVYKIEP